MTTVLRVRWMVAVGALACVLASTVYAGQNGKKEYVFRGKVEKVDAQAKKLTVNGDKVDGWMAAMVMAYSVENAEVLKSLKVGDQITAKVYEGDLVLHDVKVVSSSGAKSSEQSGSQAAPKK